MIMDTLTAILILGKWKSQKPFKFMYFQNWQGQIIKVQVIGQIEDLQGLNDQHKITWNSIIQQDFDSENYELEKLYCKDKE